MKGGESLGDEESCEEEKEVSPASILASGARPLVPDVITSLDPIRAYPTRPPKQLTNMLEVYRRNVRRLAAQLQR